jgi:hypothetical protein
MDLTCVVHNAFVFAKALEIGNMLLGSISCADDEEFADNHLSGAQFDIPSTGLGIKVCPSTLVLSITSLLRSSFSSTYWKYRKTSCREGNLSDHFHSL